MSNPKNSYSSRIKGMQTGQLREPIKIGSYKYHLMFDEMVYAWDNIELFARSDYPTIVTTTTRPNMYLKFDPFAKTEEMKRLWTEWKYYEYMEIERGYYGINYYLFGGGRICYTLPDMVDNTL